MNVAFAVVVTAVSIAGLLQHGWAYRGHFASPSLPRGAAVLTLVVVAVAAIDLWALWTGPLWGPAMAAGVLIQLASFGLFWLAISASRTARLRLAFDPSLPGSVVRHGPYRLVRHPFYLSYLVFWIGCSVAAWSAWAVPPLLVIATVYLFAARGEEGKFARSPLAREYDEYRRQTGMFWPRLARK